MTVRVLIWVACGCLTLTALPHASDRNPSYLRAAELLRPATAGATPRVRFEWEHVPGARRYVLRGRWTDGQSWAVRSAEYGVTARNATSWERDRVTFDVSLPAGAHSWNIVALFGPEERGDFASPAHLSFTLR